MIDLVGRLRERGLPSTTHPVQAVTALTVQAARSVLDDAIRRRDKSSVLDEVLELAVADAAAVLDACYEDVPVRAIPPVQYEALMGLHPPTEAQAEDGFRWNPDTFVPALLAACVDMGLDEAEWAEMCTVGPLALGEAAELFETAVRINGRSPDVRTGKGCARMDSSLWSSPSARHIASRTPNS
jgi:hypothetical protein